jgi:hypothetical protein
MAKVEAPKNSGKPGRKMVPVKVQVGEAREVVFTGDFSGWAKDKVRLAKSGNGVWSGSIELAPGEYQYRLIVDGEWRDNPAADARVPNTFGTSNCVLKVS